MADNTALKSEDINSSELASLKSNLSRSDIILLLEKVVGSRYVFSSQAEYEKLSASTLQVTPAALAFVQPAGLKEVQQIVELAAKFHFGLYANSLGANWGYGCRSPYRENDVVLDLRRLNRIIELNEDLAYVVIEPGVSQQALADYLRSRASRLRSDPSGAGPRASVLGNTLERGIGMGQYGDHFSAICGMEVVLPSAELLRTGFWNYSGSKAAHTYRYGVGPYLDGIFTQSSFGIVTKIGLWLQPKPQRQEVVFLTAKSDKSLPELAEACRELLLHQHVKSCINLVSQARLISGQKQKSDLVANEVAVIRSEQMKQFGDQLGLAPWLGVTLLEGTKDEIKAAKKALKRALNQHCSSIVSFSEQKIRFLQVIPKVMLSLFAGMNSKSLEFLSLALQVLAGEPNEMSLATTYWRNPRKSIPKQERDPVRDGCGLLWYVPVLPTQAEIFRQFLNIVYEIFNHYQFEALPAFASSGQRSFICTLPIVFDKHDANQAERALACYYALCSACEEIGLRPYRLGLYSMRGFTDRNDVYWKTVKKIKACLDPGSIMAQGRYC